MTANPKIDLLSKIIPVFFLGTIVRKLKLTLRLGSRGNVFLWLPLKKIIASHSQLQKKTAAHLTKPGLQASCIKQWEQQAAS